MEPHEPGIVFYYIVSLVKNMSYLLYLKRSLMRRTRRHLSLAVILTCAFILPLLISIYRDSSAYGNKMFLLDLSKGASFRIENAVEDDASYFQNIPGLSSPEYVDGELRFTVLSDEEWMDMDKLSRYGILLQQIVEENDLSRLHICSYDYNTAHGIPNSSENSEQKSLLLLNFIIIVISSFIIGSAYKSHLRRFSSDIGVLRSCGADSKQIFTIFFTEFIVIFIVSALTAVGISAVIMKLLFMSFLQIDNSDVLSWLIFRIDVWSTLLHILVFFVVLTFVIARTLIKFGRQSTIGAVHSDIQTLELKKTPKKLIAKASPEKTLCALWLQRANKTNRSCLLVAVPIMSVFMFLFSYLSLNADYISSVREYEIWMFKEPEFGGYSQEDIDFIEDLEYVESVRSSRDAPEELFNLEAGGLMIDKIEIKLTQPQFHTEVEEILKQRFSGVEYNILNFQAAAEEGMEMSKGIYLMLAMIFAAMFLFVLIIVYMKLSDYIDDSRKTVKILSILGASNKTIKASYFRQSLVAAIVAAVLPTVISVALYIPATASVVQKTNIDIWAILGYLIVCLMMAAAFILPVRRSLNVIFEKRCKS